MFKTQFQKTTLTLVCALVSGLSLMAQKEYGVINSGEIINKGAALHDEQKYEEALEFYNQVPENDTNYALATVEKAFTYYAQKKYEKTITFCEEALQYGTDYDNNLYLTLGSAYDDSGKPDKAIEVYDKAIKIFPKNHSLLFNKAVTLEKQEKYAEAIELYKQVLQITPYHVSTHYRLGHLAELEGDLTRAMLCYNTFLVVEPGTERALSVLQALDNMVNKKYDDSKAKGIQFAEDGEDFSEIETLIRKQLALNKNYKLESRADYPITRQNQALLSYLVNHKGNKGFWEKFYVPLYAQIYKEGRFDDFSYYILSSSDNDKVKSLVAKNRGAISKFSEWLVDAFLNVTSKRKIEVEGKLTDVKQIYYKGGNLYGIGPYLTGTDKKAGSWKYYHTNGRLMSYGTYDNTGEQTGDWKFYYFNGVIKRESKLLESKGMGPYKIYNTNGNLKEDGTFKAGELDGEIKTFTWYGGLEELHHFNNGQHEGKYQEYYPNGKMKFNSAYTNNKLNGVYEYYHPDGKLSIEGKIKDGSKEGPFTVYFRDGKVELKKSYTLDKEEGAFVKYYSNGKTRQEGVYKNGKAIGTWKSYFLNGQIEDIINYNDAGNENGLQQIFDIDGKLYYEAELKDGRVVQFKYLDKNGKILTEAKVKSKQEIKVYYSTGTVHWIGNLDNGKRNGLWKEYARNGILIGEFNYSDGSLNGLGKVYFYNGKINKEINYKNGAFQGEYLEYFRNGKLYKSAWYENGEGQGDVTTYNKSGVKERYYTLLNGQMNGKSYTYDAEGKLNAVEKYDKGILTGLIFYDTTGKELKNIPIDKEKVEVEYPSIANKILMKRTFINGSKEGTSNSYYLDNKIDGEGSYLNDEREGPWKWYNPDNTPSVVRNYVSGNLEGVSENYDLFGKIRSTYPYVDNNIQGTQTIFYYNGNKKEEVSYWGDDEHGPTKYFGFNGEHVMTLLYEYGTLAKVVYVNGTGGKPDTIPAPVAGTIEAKYANGKPAFILEYKNGYQHGKYREFFEDGTPSREAQYVDDQLEGERKTWYRNGKLRSIENYKMNDDDGETTLYYESGIKKAELTYKNDDLHGPVKYYDATGKLTAHYIFYNRDMIKKVL